MDKKQSEVPIIGNIPPKIEGHPPVEEKIEIPEIQPTTTDNNTDIKQKKPLNKKLIILAVIALLLGLFTIYYLLGGQKYLQNLFDKNQNSTEEKKDNDTQLPIDEENTEELDGTSPDPEYDEIGMNTDLELKDHRDFLVSVSNNEMFEEVVPGIVLYYKYADFGQTLSYPSVNNFPKGIDGVSLSMIKKDTVEGTKYEDAYNALVSDITNRNTEAKWLVSNTPDIFVDDISGAGFNFVSEIPNIQIPQAEKTFSTLSLGGYQYIPSPGLGSPGITVSIYAIVGDNLLRYSIGGNMKDTFGVTDADHKSCEVMDNESNDYIYDIECLKSILKKEQYQTNISNTAKILVSLFALK